MACGLGSEEEYVRLIGKLAEEDRREMKFDSRKRLYVVSFLLLDTSLERHTEMWGI